MTLHVKLIRGQNNPFNVFRYVKFSVVLVLNIRSLRNKFGAVDELIRLNKLDTIDMA